MSKKTAYLDVHVTEDLISLVEAQVASFADETLARFLCEVEEQGCHLRLNFYKNKPQCTIYGVGRGEKGNDVGVAAVGGTYPEAILMAYMKVHTVLDWDFSVVRADNKKPAPRWG